MKPLSNDELRLLKSRIERERQAGLNCRNWSEPPWMEATERLIAEVEGYRAAPLMVALPITLKATHGASATFGVQIIPAGMSETPGGIARVAGEA